MHKNSKPALIYDTSLMTSWAALQPLLFLWQAILEF
jgi:hypothetical protein